MCAIYELTNTKLAKMSKELQKRDLLVALIKVLSNYTKRKSETYYKCNLSIDLKTN